MKRLLLLSAGMMLCSATSVLAQKKSNLDGEKILADFARCTVRATPRETAKLLDTLPESESERLQVGWLLQKHGRCLKFGPSIQDRQLAAELSLGRTTLESAFRQSSGQLKHMRFPSRALRGAIAERLYLETRDAQPLAMSISDPIVDRGSLLPVGYAVVRCAAEKDTVSADRLVRAPRLSLAEASAARDFGPALQMCARGKQHVDISGTAIHGWAAEALYKMRRPVAMKER